MVVYVRLIVGLRGTHISDTLQNSIITGFSTTPPIRSKGIRGRQVDIGNMGDKPPNSNPLEKASL